MNRLGFRHDNLARTLPALLSSPHLHLEAVYTHFATADDHEHPLFHEQRERFDAALATLAALGARPRACTPPTARRCSATSACGSTPCGRGCCSTASCRRRCRHDVPLEPVHVARAAASWPSRACGRARASATGPLRRRRGRARIAVVPAGYADGLDPASPAAASCWCAAGARRSSGSVCMDMMMIDVTGIDVSPGDEVVIFGRQGDERLDVREIAAAMGTIPWDCCAGWGRGSSGVR